MSFSVRVSLCSRGTGSTFKCYIEPVSLKHLVQPAGVDSSLQLQMFSYASRLEIVAQ